MGLQQGTRFIKERNASRITATFLNTSRQIAVPASARYRIDDITGGKLCSRQVLDWTAIIAPAATETVTITAEQNRILSGSNRKERRQVTVEATGSDGEPFRQDYVYEIENLAGTP